MQVETECLQFPISSISWTKSSSHHQVGLAHQLEALSGRQVGGLLVSDGEKQLQVVQPWGLHGLQLQLLDQASSLPVPLYHPAMLQEYVRCCHRRTHHLRGVAGAGMCK